MSKANILGVTLASIMMSVALTAGAAPAGTTKDSAPIVTSTQPKSDAAAQDTTQAAKPAKHKKHKKHKKTTADQTSTTTTK